MKRLAFLLLFALTASAQEIRVNDGGQLREIEQVFVNDNSTLREVQEIYANDNGVLRLVFAAGTVTLSGEAVSSSDPGSATATIRFTAEGTVEKDENGTTTQVDSGTDWIIPNVAASSEYQIRYTNFTGSALLSPPSDEDEWIDLSEDRNFSLFRFSSNPGTSACSFTIEIRKGSSGAALDSATYTLSAQST